MKFLCIQYETRKLKIPTDIANLNIGEFDHFGNFEKYKIALWCNKKQFVESKEYFQNVLKVKRYQKHQQSTFSLENEEYEFLLYLKCTDEYSYLDL